MELTATSTGAAPNPTYQSLLLAGEELMGWRGIDAVSIRDINAQSGQKNTSAIRYHFKNKSGLIEAILKLRMTHLDALRRTEFEKQKYTDTQADMRALIRAQVLPLIDVTLNEPGWQNYILFLAQIISVRSVVAPDLWQGKLDLASRDLFAAMRKLNPDLSQPLWEQRIRDMMQMVIGSLCERVRLSNDTPKVPQLAASHYEANLLFTAQLIVEASAAD